MAAILITGGVLVDGTGASPAPASVLLDGDRVAAVGPEADARGAELATEGLVTLDATGATVMPGLIDAHCHVTFGEPQSNDELFFHRDQGYAALLAGFNVQKLLRAGVTGFLDADVLWDLGVALRDGIDAGLTEGPRMACGGSALLTSVGGTAGQLFPDRGRMGYACIVHDHAELVAEIRRQVKVGVDWIKIHSTGLVPRQSGEILVWTDEELRLACDTAHALGVPVVAHARSAVSTAACARAGVDLILHASFIDDAALEAVVESGAALCPTWTFLANLVDYGHKVGASPRLVDLFRSEIEATAVGIRKAYDAGVKLLCGSESGFSLTPYGHWHARELELFVRYLGLSPLEAITCATANGAFALRLEGQIGTVEPGRLADVIVVDGDPLADIRLLADRSRLRHVVSRGRPVDLTRPWPERTVWPKEKVGMYSTQILTYDLVNP
ncbi:MAG TPA: amidohydrolase family protein [Acidimicrobiia bacterium]|nr:amidohydrolase family protein [Acidimicrobiia bacterium]